MDPRELRLAVARLENEKRRLLRKEFLQRIHREIRQVSSTNPHMLPRTPCPE